MENRYLFRGKRTDNGEWVEGYYCKWLKGKRVITYSEKETDCIITWMSNGGMSRYEVNPATICQCTGLKDKTGKLIWENDITKLVLPDGEVRYFKVSFKKVIRKVLCHPDFEDDVAKVELNAVCFEWDGDELFPCIYEDGSSDVSNMEMAGNVFDNPELLEV